MRNRLAGTGALLLAVLLTAACGGPGPSDAAPDAAPPTASAAGPRTASTAPATGPSTAAPATTAPAPVASETPSSDPPATNEQLTVLAAASLSEAFTDLARIFEAEHPGVSVRVSLDSSATLAEQVIQGAPADVLATADIATMQRVTDAQVTDDAPEIFATNTLVLAVPEDNPAGIRRFRDLGRPGVAYVACVRTAPCGVLARSALEVNGVSAQPKSLEVDVKAVLSKVVLGEADAGLVYATDARAARDKVNAVAVPHADELVNDYAVAVLADSDHQDLAYAWVDLLVSDQGRRVLRQAGFGEP